MGTVYAAAKDMQVFKQLSLGMDEVIRDFWSRTGYHLPGNLSVV